MFHMRVAAVYIIIIKINRRHPNNKNDPFIDIHNIQQCIYWTIGKRQLSRLSHWARCSRSMCARLLFALCFRFCLIVHQIGIENIEMKIEARKCTVATNMWMCTLHIDRAAWLAGWLAGAASHFSNRTNASQ